MIVLNFSGQEFYFMKFPDAPEHPIRRNNSGARFEKVYALHLRFACAKINSQYISILLQKILTYQNFLGIHFHLSV